MKKADLMQKLKEEAIKLYEAKEAEFPDLEKIRELERVVLLKAIDNRWTNHIDDMEQLRQGIGLQAYGQRDPLVEYKMSAYDMFDEMITGITEDTVRIMYHVRIEQPVEREPVVKVTGTNKDDSLAREPKRNEEQKIYPNDPCPCGSGKKYKQCHGRMEGQFVHFGGCICGPLFTTQKEGDDVVELDQFKYKLSSYESTLLEVRDSL